MVLSGSKSWFCSITIQNLPSHRFCSLSSVCRWWAISWWMMGQSSATSNMEISSRIVSSLVSEAKTCSAKALILSSVSVMRTESSSNRNAFRSYNTMQHRTKLGGPHSGLPAMIYITKWKNLRRKILDMMYCIALHSQHIPQWCVQAPAQAYMATDWLSHYNWETLTSSIACKNHAYWGTTLMKHSRSTSLYNCVIAPNPPQCKWLFILVFDENMLKNIYAHAKTNANTHKNETVTMQSLCSSI